MNLRPLPAAAVAVLLGGPVHSVPSPVDPSAPLEVVCVPGDPAAGAVITTMFVLGQFDEVAGCTPVTLAYDFDLTAATGGLSTTLLGTDLVWTQDPSLPCNAGTEGTCVSPQGSATDGLIRVGETTVLRWRVE